MIEFNPDPADSCVSLHEGREYDLEYDVYLFWPSNGGIYLTSRYDFVHVGTLCSTPTLAVTYNFPSSRVFHTPIHPAIQSTGHTQILLKYVALSQFISLWLMTPFHSPHRLQGFLLPAAQA